VRNQPSEFPGFKFDCKSRRAPHPRASNAPWFPSDTSATRSDSLRPTRIRHIRASGQVSQGVRDLLANRPRSEPGACRASRGHAFSDHWVNSGWRKALRVSSKREGGTPSCAQSCTRACIRAMCLACSAARHASTSSTSITGSSLESSWVHRTAQGRDRFDPEGRRGARSSGSGHLLRQTRHASLQQPMIRVGLLMAPPYAGLEHSFEDADPGWRFAGPLRFNDATAPATRLL